MTTMDSSDNESISASDSGNESFPEESTKRKKTTNSKNPLKKVKYEAIPADKPRKKNDLYKAPTVEELNQLKETENLYNNNLFRLQIEELVQEVKLKKKHVQQFTKWFAQFENTLQNLEEFESTVTRLQKKNSKLFKSRYELAKNITCDLDLKVKFTKPSRIELWGLYPLNALPGPVLQATVNLTIPQDTFNRKDYLNNRYFFKRYYYLAYVANFLLNESVCDEISWTTLDGNELLPVLAVDIGKKVTVYIQATPEENAFKPSRFLCDVTNVRKDVFGSEELFRNEELTNLPKIYYNSSMAHDVTFNTNTALIKESLSPLINAQEAIKLIHVWLSQRELNHIFTDDIILYFITYLAIRKRINKHMSSYQVVRILWNFIIESDLRKNPIALCDDCNLDTFQNCFEVAFLDKTGCYNILAFWNAMAYLKIQDECRIAFQLLDSGSMNSFHNLFITKVPAQLQYDAILSLTCPQNFHKMISKASNDEKIRHYGVNKLFVIKKITDLLGRGLNKRAFYIVPLTKNNEVHFNTLTFGISLDQENAFHFLEMGPALNDPKEAEFRDFWAPLTSDRRFKDGSVCVAVYFETQTVQEKRRIICDILKHVITKKLDVKYKLFYDTFEEFIVDKSIAASYPLGSNEEGCLKITKFGDDLGQKLRALQMPLTITGIQGMSDCFNFTEVFPPIATNYTYRNADYSVVDNKITFTTSEMEEIPIYVQPIESVLQLEQSSKWPRNLEALRHMKAAFYLEISKLLSSKHQLISSVTPDTLSILYEGFVFRYCLNLPREIGLMKKQTTTDGVTVYKDTVASVEMVKKLDILPKIVGALKGIQAQYPSYGPSTAIVKRWLRAHLIDDFHISDIVINLLNAALYLNAASFKTTCTPSMGFLRFLKFIAELQEHIQPIVVDFNNEISREKLVEIDSQMLQNRHTLPNLCLIMPYDNCESLFTKNAPTKEVLRRVKVLAKETLSLWVGAIEKQQKINTKDLFTPNMEGYNAIINVNSALNPHANKNVANEAETQISLPSYDPKKSNKFPITGFNPVESYLKDLRKLYGEFALFFHNTYGGNSIGVLWLPKTLQEVEFKVHNVNGRKLKDGKLVTNFDVLIEDFRTLGKGLVDSVDY